MFACVHLGAPLCRRVNSGARCSTRARKGVVVFIRFRLGSLGRLWGLSVSFGFASGVPKGRQVHSVSREFSPALLALAGFIQFRVHSP